MRAMIAPIFLPALITIAAIAEVPATQAQRPVGECLDKLKSEQMSFKRNQIAAQRAAIAAFDPLIKSAVDSGNHDNVNLWEKARDDFMREGKLPENPPADLKKALEACAEKKIPPRSLLEAYDAAIAALNAAGGIDRARELQKQKDELFAVPRPATAPTSR